MKKILRTLALILVLGICTLALTGCESSIGRTVSNVFGKSEIVYTANTRFLYSTDGGVSWSETIQEIPVNTTYYLSVEMQVSQSEKTKDEKTIGVRITIPSTEILDCFLDDHPGISITGKQDLNNSRYYDFNIVASTTPTKFRVVFECKPLKEGRAQVQVVYDDNVSTNWDQTGTIKYVAASNGEE